MLAEEETSLNRPSYVNFQTLFLLPVPLDCLFLSKKFSFARHDEAAAVAPVVRPRPAVVGRPGPRPLRTWTQPRWRRWRRRSPPSDEQTTQAGEAGQKGAIFFPLWYAKRAQHPVP